MLSNYIIELDKKIIELQKIIRLVKYETITNGQFVNTQPLEIGLVQLMEGVKQLKQSEMAKQEYEEMYGNPDEEDHNPFVKVFKEGTNNPFIKRFGGKHDSRSGRRGGISTENRKSS